MSDNNQDSNNRPSIFKQALEAGSAILEAQIQKSKASMQMNEVPDTEDFLYAKAITEDPNYSSQYQGWKVKQFRLLNGQLKQMAYKNSVVASIIRTYQNKAAAHAKPVETEQERGFMIKLRDEDLLLEKIKDELKQEVTEGSKKDKDQEDTQKSLLMKADEDGNVKDSDTNMDDQDSVDEAKNSMQDDEAEEFDWELERKARAKLHEMFKEDKKKVERWLMKCGDTDQKPLSLRRWNFESALKAFVWDSLTYDLYAREMVPDRAGRPAYWFPVDGGTIHFAPAQLKNYKDVSENFINLDLLYPEKQAKQMEQQKKLDIDPDLLEADAYQYLQIVRGKVERVYTVDELSVGIRNRMTDIYNNGYGISELEMAIGLVSGHLNAEFYNQAYFTQGFSAKGILHIKAAMNRRKLETIRQQWQHMLKGSRNSFQTPIFAGMNEVQWIPLTQNHQDIGFEGWMRYLIRMLCAIYQIDPGEIGINLKDEGKGGGLSGDNTEERYNESKERGLYPLMSHLENFINEEIIAPFDNRFCIKFTGMTSETRTQALERQKKESEFKKTVNEIRAEDGLPPLPGMDDFILSPTYVQWYDKYSKKAVELREEMSQMDPGMMGDPGSEGGGFDGGDDDEEILPQDAPDLGTAEDEESTEKSRKLLKSRPLKIEYYRLGSNDGED